MAMLGKLATLVVNALTGILTARYLAPAGRGEQAAMTVWPLLLAGATTLGLPLSLAYHLRKATRPAGELVACGLVLSFIITLNVGSATYLVLPSFLTNYPHSTVSFARLLLVTIPIGSFMIIARAVLEAEGKFGSSISAQFVIPALTLVMLTAFIIIGKLTPITAAMCYTVNGIPVAIWLFREIQRTIPLRLTAFLKNSRTLLSYGLPAYGMDLCGILSQYVDQALVIHFLQPNAMGIYVVALSVSRMLNFCHVSVAMVLLPKALSIGGETAVGLIVRAARSSMIATGIIAICGAIASPLAIKMLYGPSFESAIAPLRLLLAEAVISGTIMVLTQAALTLARPGLVTSLQLTGLLVTVPLMFLLLPRYGIVGAALALLLSTTLRMVLILGSFPLALGHSIPSLIPKRSDFQELWLIGNSLLWGGINARRSKA